MNNLSNFDEEYSCNDDFDNYSQQSYKSSHFKKVKIPSLTKKGSPKSDKRTKNLVKNNAWLISLL